LALVS